MTPQEIKISFANQSKLIYRLRQEKDKMRRALKEVINYAKKDNNEKLKEMAEEGLKPVTSLDPIGLVK